MALFGSSQKTVTTSNKVRPTVVRTQNVAKELQKIAKSYETSVDKLDFNIFDVQTYTRMFDGSKETEWELVGEDELYELDEESALLNPFFQMKQMYEVEIFSKSSQHEIYKDLKLAVGANATKCKVYLSILANSQVKYSSSFEDEFRMMIKKRKIRAGILVDIFDEMVEDVVSKLVAHIRVSEKVVYKENKTILIAQSYEPTLTINDSLLLHYEKKDDIDEKTKIDYASRGFIKNVTEGEILIEYIKAKEGKPGRNCRGEYMSPTEPIIANEPTFGIDDTIKIQETDNSIKYIAKENGYIAFDDNTYKIKTDVDIDQISFKTTGSISSGRDSDVSIVVTETDAVKDAVGVGMHVEVSEIEIEGNVGSNAHVSALKASIGGQTHKTSTIRADELDINVHKGHGYGKNIKITRLEHGEVDGDFVSITQAIGGVIRAKEIDIEICASHVKATASKRIEIQKLQGSENIFTIDPLVKKDAKKGLHDNEENVDELKLELRNLKVEIQKYNKLIKGGMAAFLDVKKRLLHYKKSGVKMPASFVKKFKEFQAMQEMLKNLQKDFEEKNDKLNLLDTQKVSFQDDILDARVINRSRWIGFNEIRFKLVEPDIELVYKPKEGTNDKIFGLVEVEEGEYEIRPLDE